MKPKTKMRLLFYPALYLLVAMYLYIVQNSLIYFPTDPVAHSFDTIAIENEGALLDVIVVHSESAEGKVMLYFGGNAEAVGGTANELAAEFTDHTVYALNYRGYGKSTGEPSETANYSDALKVFGAMQAAGSNITIIGRSLGCGVATFVASQREISALILVTPYDSIQSVAQSTYKIFPMSLLLHEKYRSIDHVPEISVPCLAVIAERDEFIAYKHSQKMVSAFPPSQMTPVIITKATHNDISSYPEYYQAMKSFMGYPKEGP